MKTVLPSTLSADVEREGEFGDYRAKITLRFGNYPVCTWVEENFDHFDPDKPWGDESLDEFIAGKLAPLFTGLTQESES